jgi:kinesin family protein C1
VEYETRLAEEKKRLAEESRLRRIEEENERKMIREAAIQKKGLIRAFVRVRPPRKQKNSKDDDLVVEVHEEVSDSLALIDVKGQDRRTKEYYLDHVFPPSSSQEQVFCEVQDLVESAMDGNQVCIMAYGQTGSGKTFTMEGTDENPGLIPRAAKHIFDELSSSRAQDGWAFRVKVSATEIYNNKIYDLLLAPEEEIGNRKAGMTKTLERKELRIIPTNTGSLTISDLTRVEVFSPEEIFCSFEHALKSRRMGSTKMNATSSRSHFIFQIDLCGQRLEEQSRGCLTLIDLAGSEALSAAQKGIQQTEGKHIRESLTALKTFLHQHAQGNPGSMEKKLTHFMKMIMGRGAKLLVIANISPNAEFFSQTKDALDFISGIAKLKSKAEVQKRAGVQKKSIG